MVESIESIDVDYDKSVGEKYKKFTEKSSYDLIERYAISYAFWQIEFNNLSGYDKDKIAIVTDSMKHIMGEIKEKFSIKVQDRIFDKVKIIVRKCKGDNSSPPKGEPKKRTKQKDNDICKCGSNRKYKKCCKFGAQYGSLICNVYDYVCKLFIDENIMDCLVLSNAVFSDALREIGLSGKVCRGYKNYDGKIKYNKYHCWTESYGIAYDLEQSILYYIGKSDPMYYEKNTDEYVLVLDKDIQYKCIDSDEFIETMSRQYNDYNESVLWSKIESDKILEIRDKAVEHARKLFD